VDNTKQEVDKTALIKKVDYFCLILKSFVNFAGKTQVSAS